MTSNTPNRNPFAVDEAALQELLDTIGAASAPNGRLPPSAAFDDRCIRLLADLRSLSDADLASLGKRDESCPICHVPLVALIAEEEHALAMDSPAHPTENLGVTKLSKSWQCGHLFCRKDITKWIRDGNDSCPLCRQSLLDPSVQTRTERTHSPLDDPVEIFRRFGINIHSTSSELPGVTSGGWQRGPPRDDPPDSMFS